MSVLHRLGRAMADLTRSRRLRAVLDGPGYPETLARELELSRSNVSNHPSCLRGCGIIVAVPEGRSTRYEIADAPLTRALVAVLEAVLAVDNGMVCSDETCALLPCCGAVA